MLRFSDLVTCTVKMRQQPDPNGVSIYAQDNKSP